MLQVTVAIPVYNSGKHLPATLESLLHQTMHANNFEIICVNDCSTDNSKEVIKAYAQKMSNLVLINLEKNTGGPMEPRNVAIRQARGKYIHFLDCDDFLGEEALERLYNAAEEYGSDVIFGRHVRVNGRTAFLGMFNKGNISQASLLTHQLVYALAPHKMFRTSFLNDHQLLFDPQAKGGNEDQIFVFACYLKAKVITVLADYGYYFIVARGNENLTSKVYPANVYFHAPNKVLSVIEAHFTDEAEKSRYKALYLSRFLESERLRKFLLDPDFPMERKKEYLAEGKRFLEPHTDSVTLQAINPKYLDFLKAVIAEDWESLKRMTTVYRQQLREQVKKKSVKLVVAKHHYLKAYNRPSVNASLATRLGHGPFQVFFSVAGWFEIRLPEAGGAGTYPVFVQSKDVRYTLSTMLQHSVQRFKKMMA
jgi:glycosyltransferase involved in cell wall biosynthesis